MVAVMRLRRPPPRWIAVALRRLGWDRNPMRRATDRIQALLRAVLLAMLVIGGPIATAYVGHAAYTSAARAARAQAVALAPGTGAYPARRAGSHALAASGHNRARHLDGTVDDLARGVSHR